VKGWKKVSGESLKKNKVYRVKCSVKKKQKGAHEE
jgi:hypothetical protein